MQPLNQPSTESSHLSPHRWIPSISMTYAYLFTPSFKVSPNMVDHVASFLPAALCYLPSLAVLLLARWSVNVLFIEERCLVHCVRCVFVLSISSVIGPADVPCCGGVSYRVYLIAVLQMLPAQRQLAYKTIPQGSVAAGPLSGARFKTLRDRKPPR